LEDSSTIFNDLLRHRLILHFKDHGATVESVEKNIAIYVRDGGFQPEVMIVDGYPVGTIGDIELAKWQTLAKNLNAEIWFSATLPLVNQAVSEFIKPFQQHFSVVIELNSHSDHIELKLIKDHDATTLEKLLVKLDPKTLLIANRRI
jgi:hypothetical protein